MERGALQAIGLGGEGLSIPVLILIVLVKSSLPVSSSMWNEST